MKVTNSPYGWGDEVQIWTVKDQVCPVSRDAYLPSFNVDIRTPVQYAEDKHKDDVATLKKKWKYL